nr:unnamed protein product [Callosobruchus chinensis]
MHRKVEENGEVKFLPINKVIINFHTQELPKYVTINHVIFEVTNYVQKVILCHNCLSQTNTSTRYTQMLVKSPKRYVRPTQDPTEEARRDIISKTVPPNNPGGVLSSPYYVANKEGINDDKLTQSVLDLVLFVLSNLKEVNLDNLTKNDIEDVIKNRLATDSKFFSLA